jgi:outer membrane receptor protein involved in Fe transport
MGIPQADSFVPINPLGVFVRNVADKRYWTSTALGGDTLTRFAGMPRTFGISWGLNF